MWGTFIALYALAWGIKGLQLSLPANSTWVQPLFQGVSLLAAVSLASHQGVVKVRRSKAAGADADADADADAELSIAPEPGSAAVSAPARAESSL